MTVARCRPVDTITGKNFKADREKEAAHSPEFVQKICPNINQRDLSMTASYEFMRSILDTSADHIVVIDAAGNIVFANRAWNTFGRDNDCLTKEDWRGLNYLEECDASGARGDDVARDAADGIRKFMSAEKDSFYLEYPCDSPSEKRWFIMRMTSFKSENASYFVISHHNITERKLTEIAFIEQSKRLEVLALYDALTGLGNRNLFLKQLEHLIAIAKRKKEEVALLVMDLDGFKEVNDRLGHAAGDEVLRVFGTRLNLALREADQTYRIGGDEFAVLLDPRSDSLEGARIVAEKIAQEVTVPMTIKGHDCAIGVSIGVAVYPLHGEEPNTLVRKADAAMYEAKKTDQVVAAASEIDATVVLKGLQIAD